MNSLTKKLKLKKSKKDTLKQMKSLNQSLIQMLENLEYIMKDRKDFMRAKAYGNAKLTIENYKHPITRLSQLENTPTIGKTIYEKMNTYIKTGKLDILEEEKELIAKKNAANIFMDIYGVGEKKASDIVKNNIYTINDLRKNKNLLNDVQIIGLKYYEDILQRIPRKEIDVYNTIFNKHYNGKMEIVGSYRRNKPDSGDIDVILTGEEDDYISFIDLLIKEKIIREVLSRGKKKCLVIAKLPQYKTYRRVDFLFTPEKSYAFALLYFTGSKEFNTLMRERALKMGYTLNEHNLSKMDGRKKGAIVDRNFRSEKDIFDFLQMKYKEPHERDENAIVYGGGPKTSVHIAEFSKKGIHYLDNLSEKELSDMVQLCNNAFHGDDEPLLDDNTYDILRDYIEVKYPKNTAVKDVGCEVKKDKVKLPYEMWSMDKIKPDSKVLESWKKKYVGPYIISCKLDGVSGLYTTEGEQPQLYTRGDGKVGQNISHMIPYLQLPKEKGLVIRGELIIKKSVFDEKYKDSFANPRNLVAGIVNQKSKSVEKYKDIVFVGYEVIKYNFKDNIKPSDQMHLLDTMNIETVKYLKLDEKELTNENLSSILQKWRSSYVYEIDGIIVCNDDVYMRTSSNPKHAFAFKMVLSDQIAEAHVVDVLWAASKDGYLKPRVQISPVTLGGVKITYVTGFNASFIEKNKIGVGSVIMLIRSGDVIPYIQSVTVQAKEAKMPEVEYIYNDTGVDILLKNKDEDNSVLQKKITGFFTGIGVEGLAAGNVKKIMEAGYNSICKIIHISKSQLLNIEGFKEKMAHKIYTGIQEKISSSSIVLLAAVSGSFGRGFSEKKIQLVYDAYPDIFVNKSIQHVDELLKIKGIEKKTAQAFIDHIENFIQFLKECDLFHKLQEKVLKVEVKKHMYNDKNIVMSGFRNKDLEEQLKNVGASIGSSVNKNTYLLIVKSMQDNSSKIKDAKKYGVTIVEVDKFSI